MIASPNNSTTPAMSALLIARNTFWRYSKHHEEKGDVIKAKDNAYLAELMQCGIDSLEVTE